MCYVLSVSHLGHSNNAATPFYKNKIFHTDKGFPCTNAYYLASSPVAPDKRLPSSNERLPYVTSTAETVVVRDAVTSLTFVLLPELS